MEKKIEALFLEFGGSIQNLKVIVEGEFLKVEATVQGFVKTIAVFDENLRSATISSKLWREGYKLGLHLSQITSRLNIPTTSISFK